MSKRLVWRLEEDTLIVGMNDGPKGEYQPLWRGDMKKAYPNTWDKMDDVEKNSASYGVKQKLSSDCLAKPKNEKLKRHEIGPALGDGYKRIYIDRVWELKPIPMTPLDKAIKAKEEKQAEMDKARKIMLDKGVDKKQADDIIKTLYGEALTALSETIKKLEKQDKDNK